jgi:hypothetical protein
VRCAHRASTVWWPPPGARRTLQSNLIVRVCISNINHLKEMETVSRRRNSVIVITINALEDLRGFDYNGCAREGSNSELCDFIFFNNLY